jgi:hypothetical protein
MAMHEWSLISDELTGTALQFSLNADDIPGTPSGWHVSLRTLQSGLSQGVHLVEIANGRLRFAVIPTRGMGLWRAWMNDRELGWRSPVRGPVHPYFVPCSEPSGLGWLTGFDELMCRCGLESNGAPDFDDRGNVLYPLHGRVANLPARDVRVAIDDVAGTISLSGVVDEARFHFQKLRLRTTYTTSFGSSRICWHDEVENFGGSVASMQMLYHTNIGQPQLDAGSTLIAPVASVGPGNADTVAMGTKNWDRYGPPDPQFRQQVYQLGLLSDDCGKTRVLVKDSAEASGVQLNYNVEQLPYFSLWRNLVPEADGYVTGIEPATNYPNPRTYESQHGRVIDLPPGETWKAELALDWLLEPAAVAQAERDICELKGGRKVTTYADIVEQRSDTR